MLNFPGLRGPADVRGGGPHAGALVPSKGRRRGTERSWQSATLRRFAWSAAGIKVQHNGWILSGPQVWADDDVVEFTATRESLNISCKNKSIRRCVFIYEKLKGPCLHPKVLRWHTLRYIQFIFSESNETAEEHLSE